MDEVRTNGELKGYMDEKLMEIDPSLSNEELDRIFCIYKKNQRWEGMRMVTGATYNGVKAFVRVYCLISESGRLLQIPQSADGPEGRLHHEQI